jgi:hypothetical protein
MFGPCAAGLRIEDRGSTGLRGELRRLRRAEGLAAVAARRLHGCPLHRRAADGEPGLAGRDPRQAHAKLPNWIETAIESRVKRSEAEICGKIRESFGELMGRISAIDPTQARAARGEPFRFANEKADRHDEPVIDLPNWRRGNGTVVN